MYIALKISVFYAITFTVEGIHLTSSLFMPSSWLEVELENILQVFQSPSLLFSILSLEFINFQGVGYWLKFCPVVNAHRNRSLIHVYILLFTLLYCYEHTCFKYYVPVMVHLTLMFTQIQKIK